MARKPKKIQQRSIQWFGRQDIYGFIYRSWVKNRGVPQDQFDGRPVIGICNTYSELVPCNSHFRTIAEHVRVITSYSIHYTKLYDRFAPGACAAYSPWKQCSRAPPRSSPA